MKLQCLAVLAVILGSGSYASGADLVLSQAGKSDYQIVLPESSAAPSVTEGLQQTARLLQVALQANGAGVAVVTESKRDASKPTIWLGETTFAREHKVDLKSLTGWGYVHRVVGKDVIIAGRDHVAPAAPLNERRPTWARLGTAKGVVDFVQKYVGVRFVYPDLAPYQPISAAGKIDILKSPAFEFLPVDPVIVPTDLDVTMAPLIEFNTAHPARGSFYDIAHNRFPLVDTIFGGHTWERAVPPEKFAAEHPEYFALIGGKRTANEKGNAQYCISHPEVRELFYQDLISGIDRGYDVVDLGQPDGFRACQCDACNKLYNTGADWAEKIWLMNRELAERVEKARPGKLVTMISYIQTERPPKAYQRFPSNTRIMLTGTNEEDIAPWRGHEVPGGFSSYIYNWCPNLGSRYTPMRTPRFVEAQVKRLVANKIQSVYRDGPGDLYGLEGPTYYTMGRMFDDPEHLSAKSLMHEFCGAAFGKSAPSMIAFYDQLYHGIELYSEYLGTRSPAWTYQDIYGRRRKHLTDPLQFLGFLYTPNLLSSLEQQLASAERLAQSDKTATGEKVRMRLAQVRREFDYLKALAKVVHLAHAYQIQPDLASRDRLLDAIDSRNAFIDSMFSGPRGGPTQLPGFSFVLFPQLGHDAKHLRLSYDGYQEPFANSVMNWDTKLMRSAPLPGAKRMLVKPASGPITWDAAQWEKADPAEVSSLLQSGPSSVANAGSIKASKTTARAIADNEQLHIRIETATESEATDLIELYLETGSHGDSASSADKAATKPTAASNIIYRFTVGPQPNSKQDAANGFNTDPLDPRFGHFDSDWNGEWKYQSQVDAATKRWVAMVSIPFKTLGVTASPSGTFWRGNIARVRGTGSQLERALWSAGPSAKVVDDRNDFGEIVFEAATLHSAPQSSKHPLTTLREKLYAESFEIPAEWKSLTATLPLDPETWLFRADSIEVGIKENWFAADANTKDWISMRVPSFWAETESVGKYTGYGWHRTTFSIPVEWKARRVRLLIGSVDEQAWVYLNGKQLREHTEKSERKSINDLWETPFAVDLPSEVLSQEKPNTLVIRVHNSLANGGLWRPVWLHAVE